MSKIINGGLDQYGGEHFEQQQFGTAGVEGVNVPHSPTLPASVNDSKHLSRRKANLGCASRLYRSISISLYLDCSLYERHRRRHLSSELYRFNTIYLYVVVVLV